jgi:hypothetical protein
LKEKKNNKIIKKILGTYNVDFLAQWIQSINFKIWMNDHDRNICLRSNYISHASSVHILYENGDTYNGSISFTKKTGFGILNDVSNSMIYNGNWENDMVISLNSETRER